MLKDSFQREQATDPSRSFIVQAPAGSGKTELLTQRYLRLLSTVEAPEQIIALTFTRKAASEMRERILLALEKTAAGAQANSPHQQQTYRYAREALQHSAHHNWQLLEQPGRLRIITIDSLCQMLNHAIPVVDKQISYAQITEMPQNHYLSAARACLAYALGEENLHQPIRCLLDHLDNRQDRLLELLSNLLAHRDQWLNSLYTARDQDKSSYEHMLALIEKHALDRLVTSISMEQGKTLCLLVRQLAGIDLSPDSPRHSLCNWLEFNQLDRQNAAALASLVLTSEGNLRKAFDHHIGLKRGVCEDSLYNHLKTTSKTLLAELGENSDFIDALMMVKNLPEPHYDLKQWEVLKALFILLPLLVAHLHIEFKAHNEVDFSAVSQQALEALGDDDQPTELALYLDHQIQHLLVDEFQDTSIQQFQLLSKLVQEWLPEEHRTLFVVGDPMQSIYRFRQAEVGLFLKAQLEGIGPVSLINLNLCCNFRSSENLVTWVNNEFKVIFPQQDNIELGAISFHSSVSVLGINDHSHVKAWHFSDRLQEANALVRLVIEELANNPQERIAILARSRSQLSEIMQLLREHHISFQGMEIERLSTLPHMRDLWSLTQALLLPANRLAWLALLRSPFCGLSLQDLHAIANFSPKKSIYFALSQLDNIIDLSADGRQRSHFFYMSLKDILACRHQLSLVDWLAKALKRLHGDHILSPNQKADVEQFWLLLERFTQNKQLPDLKQLKIEFNKLYSQRVTPSNLQIMTIHKSKGLEFDCVILPSLNAKPKNKETPLLRWLKLPSQEHGELLLVSPIKAAYREDCLLYDYLAKLDAEKNHYELQRLLYVATTRAKKRLYLFDSSEKETKGSLRSFLHQEFLTTETEEVNRATVNSLPVLQRLPSELYHNLPLQISYRANQTLLTPTNTNARQIGIVAHELLQWVCDNHPHSINDLPWNLVEQQFKQLGFDTNEQFAAHHSLREQINLFLTSSIGQWISKAHHEEQNEYELLVNDNGLAVTRILDRTFVDQGIRWIIDFKTGGELVDTINKHRQQVNGYALWLSHFSQEPISCGLYYLQTGNWVHWDYKANLLEQV